MLIGIDAIPPRGGNSGGAIQSLNGCGAISYLESPPLTGITVVWGADCLGIIIIGGCGFIKYAKNKKFKTCI
jgi:hypothetical protein